jgi:hypothetical protein
VSRIKDIPKPATKHSDTNKRSPWFVSNYTERPREGDQPPERVPLVPQQIVDDIIKGTNGLPYRLRGLSPRLFVPHGDRVQFLDTETKLFGWLSGVLGMDGGGVRWGGRHDRLIPKAEFFAYLQESPDLKTYDDIQFFPHYPPMPGVLYLHPPIPERGNGALAELLSHFNPATETDRHLIKAMFMTLVWGGKLGGRPLFVIESSNENTPGQGHGKSTLAKSACKLTGGCLMMPISGGENHGSMIEKRLLSESGREHRNVVFDNVKGRSSSSDVEGIITSEKISGQQLYKGDGSRPNFITWIITANEPNLSKDFSHRAVPIRIDKPANRSHQWERRVDWIINNRRWEIIADIRDALAGPSLAVGQVSYSRWAEWEAEVLERVTDPTGILATLSERRNELDDDANTAGLVREIIAQKIRSQYSGDPELIWCKIDCESLANIVRKEYPGTTKTTRAILIWLGRLRVQSLRKDRTTSARWWEWVGTNSIAETPLEWNQIPP